MQELPGEEEPPTLLRGPTALAAASLGSVPPLLWMSMAASENLGSMVLQCLYGQMPLAERRVSWRCRFAITKLVATYRSSQETAR
jgi:hypothetical protein